MRNGHFPEGKCEHACYFADVHHINHLNRAPPPADHDITEFVSNSARGGLKNTKMKKEDRNWGYSFTFGGRAGRS